MKVPPAETLQADRDSASGQALATCPLCHTVESTLSIAAVAAGGDWKCRVCGQFWDARRLAAHAAYKVWAAAQGPVARAQWTVARYARGAPSVAGPSRV